MPSILFHSFQNTSILFGLRMPDPLVKPKYVLLSLALPWWQKISLKKENEMGEKEKRNASFLVSNAIEHDL